MIIEQLSTVSADTTPIEHHPSWETHEGEFWTSRQRQASSLHEVSYRACFKPQLPRFFIERYSTAQDTVYDPFMGRGTVLIEAALHGRNVIGNDVNPLSEILTRPRLEMPKVDLVKDRIESIQLSVEKEVQLRYEMFFHADTERELHSLRTYLKERKESGKEDEPDRWIRMVATNRLTGHSRGFLSVYTLPPNQAATAEQQIKINEKLQQIPEYRSVRHAIWKKTKSLMQDVTVANRRVLRQASQSALYLSSDACSTPEIPSESVQLTITSPPFLNVVNYVQDNWLRCWFNSIDVDEISGKITMAKSVAKWSAVMQSVFHELFRVTRPGGWVAFEVGEIRNGSIRLEEIVVPLGQEAGFECRAVMINKQEFTKTANIWGVKNNKMGTNTNRIVLFQKT